MTSSTEKNPKTQTKEQQLSKVPTIPGVRIGQALQDTQRWFKSATPSDLLEWVESSESFNASQQKRRLKELGGYDPGEKSYGDVYHWGAFCAIGL